MNDNRIEDLDPGYRYQRRRRVTSSALESLASCLGIETSVMMNDARGIWGSRLDFIIPAMALDANGRATAVVPIGDGRYLDVLIAENDHESSRLKLRQAIIQVRLSCAPPPPRVDPPPPPNTPGEQRLIVVQRPNGQVQQRYTTAGELEDVLRSVVEDGASPSTIQVWRPIAVTIERSVKVAIG